LTGGEKNFDEILLRQLADQDDKVFMLITSPAFEDSGIIPNKYTCDGDNINPPLRFISAPEAAQSLVLIVDDADAPSGTWVHWIVINIDSKVNMIHEGVSPAGAKEGINSFGNLGYDGPCPPTGTHRYFFRLYALDKKLEVISIDSKEEVEQMMAGHIIAQAELVGQYSRQ
jgi:Raf kinase inhibitor-like YbhB/YbcL family protein